MADQNLSRGLTALAEHAGRTGRLAVAADVRTRGDRRRHRRYAASAGLGLMVAAAFGAGIALGQPRAANGRPVVPQVPAASHPAPELPLPAVPPPVLPAPAVSSSPAVSIPPGVPRSPIKAPPPQYPYTGDPAVPATLNPTP
jgi:hypothetical protein